MAQNYGNHHTYIGWVKDDADSRESELEEALNDVFSEAIEMRSTEIVLFSDMTALDLAGAIIKKPIILKAMLAICNIAGRAIERDLGIKNLDTYNPKLTNDNSKVVAGYIKPFLPPFLPVKSLIMIDRVEFIDKEIRKVKGRWERRIVESLNKHSPGEYRKRMFHSGGESFELDAATPLEGQIHIGIDIKRIEARRDIHKRCDEVINKGRVTKTAFPEASFGVVVYYPFIDEQVNIQSRLNSSDIDGLVFASDSDDSIDTATRLLISTLQGITDDS